MQQLVRIDSYGFAPSFSCYSSDSITSTAVAKVIREQQFAQFHFQEDDFNSEFEFEFSPARSDHEVVEIVSTDWTIFPVFNHDRLVNNEVVVDRGINVTDEETDDSSAVTVPLGKLFHREREESSSYSSSEGDESEELRSGTNCVVRRKADADGGSPPLVTKIKTSRSTGSGSKRWICRFLLRRTKSEGKQPAAKKADSPKQKRDSGEVSGERRKARTPVHEQFYMQRRAENEIRKRKSYLPYRKHLVGLFAIAR